MADATELLHGTLDTLVLKILAGGARHGYAIARWIQDATGDALQVGEGSLYPALYRLEDRGWIAGEEGASPEGRRIRVYRLTAAGRRQLAREVESWRAFASAVDLVLTTAQEA